MFYILHGEDAFRRGEELAKLIARMGDPGMTDLNTTRLDGQSITWNELLHHCDSIPFFSDKRLVVIHGVLTRLSGSQASDSDHELLERLADWLPEMPATTRLVFVEERTLPAKHPILRLAETLDDGHIRHFATPEGNALIRWIQKRAQAEGGEIDTRAARMLASYTQENLYQLDKEIEKLAAYTGGERPITEQDIQLLTSNAQEANIFHMVDAMGQRDGKRATQLYHQLLDRGAHPLSLLGMMVRQYRLMIQVQELAPQLESAQAIAKALKQKPYPISKILAQSTHYTPAQLSTIYHKLLETDVAIKTGHTDPVLALDMLIAGLSRTI